MEQVLRCHCPLLFIKEFIDSTSEGIERSSHGELDLYWLKTSPSLRTSVFLNELTGLYSRVMTERVSIRHCVVMPRGGRWDRAQGMVKEVRARMSQCLAELGEGVDKEDMHWKLVNPTCLFAICGCGMTWSQLTILSGVPLEVLAFLKQWGEGLVGVMRLLRSYLSRGGNAHLLLLTWEELRDRIGGG